MDLDIEMEIAEFPEPQRTKAHNIITAAMERSGRPAREAIKWSKPRLAEAHKELLATYDAIIATLEARLAILTQ